MEVRSRGRGVLPVSSGFWITWAALSYIAIFLMWFIPWELLNLWRGKETLSQFVMRRAREGSKFYKGVLVGLPSGLMLSGGWLFLHFEVPCLLWGKLCWLNFLAIK